MKRVVLVSLGLMLVAAQVGCLPADTGMSGTGGATGTAGTGNSGAAGNDGTGTAGTSGAAGNFGTAGTGSPGTAGTTNPGTAGDSGSAGTGGPTGTGGTNSNGGRGGTTGPGGGTAGTTGSGGRGGTTGTAGTTGTGGATGNVVCDSVKAALDGFQYLLPCGADQSYSVLVCQNPRPACTYNNSEYLVQGTCNGDKKFTIAGTSAQSCTIGMPYEGFAQGPAAGGVTSGCYPNTSGNYNVYMMHVSDSATVLGTNVTGTRYYWNAINKTEAHFSYKLDYTTPTITIKGGTTLWMLADDSNQSAIKNCDTTSVDQATTAAGGKCNPLTLSGLTTAPGAAITQPYGGQFVVLHVASAQ